MSSLLDVPIALCDPDGKVLVPAGSEPCLCKAVNDAADGRRLCAEMRLRAASEALNSKRPHIYKCHTNQYIFAVPVILTPECAFVIIGGQVYLDCSVDREFSSGAEGYGFDGPTLKRLRDGLKVIPPRSIFSLPGIVSNLAEPFLKSLYSKAAADKNALSGAGVPGSGIQGFHALEQVYKAIAPLLDREALYETILNKSTELMGAERGSLMILDHENNILSVKACKGLEDAFSDKVKIRVGEGIAGGIAATGAPRIVRDIESEVPEHKTRARYKTKSFISLPLKLEDRVIGVLNISDKITGEVFSENDLQLMLTFADYAAIALERGAYYSMSEELRHISMTDPLTGLFNRRYFRERVFEEIERVKRHEGFFTVFVLDLDDFKAFNDRFGHLAGDEILKGVSRALRESVRSMDVVARYGGEEFTALLPQTRKKDSFVIAERIRTSVEELKDTFGLYPIWPTVSIGIAEFQADANNIDDLIDKADKAMYLAKRMGKNKTVIYE